MSAPKTPSAAHGPDVMTAPPPSRPSDDRFLSHLATAGDMVASGRFREAEVEVLRALSGLPADLRALNLLALVRFKLGRVEEARATYRELAAAAPNDAPARRNLGLLAIKLEQVEEAIPHLEMAARLAPGDKQAWGYLGYAYAKKGEPVPAAAAFRRAGQDVLAAELERAATAPKLASLGSGTPVGTQKPTTGPLVLPPPTTAPRARAHTGENRAPVSVVSSTPSGLFASPLSSPVIDLGGDPERVPVPPDARSGGQSPPSLGLQGGGQAVGPPVAAVAPQEIDEGPAAELVPVPLLGFVLSRLGLGVAPRAPSGEALRLEVGDEAYVRAGAALAAVGVRFEPAFRRAQGRRSNEPLIAGGAPFYRLVGPGDVWVAGHPGRWQAVSLEDDILYVREDRVLAFDGGVSWEAGAVPGDGLRMLQFRGRGCVVLQLDSPPLAVKVTEDRPALVGRAHLIGWVGRLVTHRQRSAGPTPFELACQGEGVVLFDPPAAGPS